jgi:membrane glycosyltransferase
MFWFEREVLLSSMKDPIKMWCMTFDVEALSGTSHHWDNVYADSGSCQNHQPFAEILNYVQLRQYRTDLVFKFVDSTFDITDSAILFCIEV